MYFIGIFTLGKGWTEWTVSGKENAYAAFYKAIEFCELLTDASVVLGDAETGEIYIDSADED